MLQAVSHPEPAAFFSGFRGVSNPLAPLQTAGNSASFSGGAAPNSNPASLRMLVVQRRRPIPLMNTTLVQREEVQTRSFKTLR